MKDQPFEMWEAGSGKWKVGSGKKDCFGIKRDKIPVPFVTGGASRHREDNFNWEVTGGKKA
ncbi:MAG TPA: hypothetical protein DDW83_08865 [Peptococcaceae bacterium]|nr:hypothetical protein [Peptococcaceae bacterium]